MAYYFAAPDAYDDVALWVADGPDDPKPEPVLYRTDIRRDHRDALWPLIVAAVTGCTCPSDAEIDAAIDAATHQLKDRP